MSRSLHWLLFLTVLVSLAVPRSALAKGGTRFDYFTVEGPGILWPVRFTVDLGGHLPYDHEIRASSHEPDSPHFVVKGYVQAKIQHGFSPFYLWLSSDGQGDIYVAGNEASGFNYRWFATRPQLVPAVRQAILVGYARSVLVLGGPLVIGAIVLIGRRSLAQRSSPTRAMDVLAEVH